MSTRMRQPNLILAPITLLALLIFSCPTANALNVVSTTPIPQIIDAHPDSSIIIRFNTAIDISTIDSASVHIYGRWSGPTAFTYSIIEDGPEVELVLDPVEPFFYGEWITVNISHKLKEEASADSLVGGYAFNFWTETKPGALDQIETERITVRSSPFVHVQTYGAYAGDLNDDGWTDLASVNEVSEDLRIFYNDGAGNYSDFTIVPMPGTSIPSASEGADFNLDGAIDMAVGSGGNDIMTVLMGDGSGGFNTPTNYPVSSSVRGVAVIDLNTDGFDDLVTSNRIGSDLAIFINDQAGGFLAPTIIEPGGVSETAIAVADANNDGIQDVFIATLNSEEYIVLLGDGEGGLTVSSITSSGGRCWMVAIGDLNNDGNVDFASSNSTSNSVSVAFGDGAGALSAPTSYPSGAFTIAIDLGDLDGDGDLDMVSSNFSGNNFNVYENLGAGIFGNIRSYPASTTGSCTILHDRDNDGDLDITGVDETDDLLFIYDNIYNGVWFEADTLIGPAPISVNFTGLTNRAPTQWAWNFGDDSTSALQSPLHTFTNPGQYQVSLAIETSEGPMSSVKEKFIGVYADSVLPQSTQVPGGTTAKVDIYMRNYIDLNFAQIPISWTSNVDLTHISASTFGLRSNFMTADLASIDPINNRLVYTILAPDDTALLAGSGPVLSIFFQVPAGATIDSSTLTVGTNFAGAIEFTTPLGDYSPEGGVAFITRFCCETPGDYNHDGSFNIADVTSGIARIFAGGPAPTCQDEADANGDNQFNIADVTYGIARIFSGGPAPTCGATGS